jgi:hypothetical protein
MPDASCGGKASLRLQAGLCQFDPRAVAGSGSAQRRHFAGCIEFGIKRC